MITENAPAMLLIQLSQGLTPSEEEELRDLRAQTPQTKEEAEQVKADIEALIVKQSQPMNSTTFEGWIPITLTGSEIVPFLPDGYQSTVMKRIETIGADVVTSKTLSTSTINIKTGSSDLINSIVNACQFLYSLDDAMPRLAFFSPELVVTSGIFLSMSRSVGIGTTTEQIISIQIQNGDPSEPIRVQTAAKKEEATVIFEVGDPVTG